MKKALALTLALTMLLLCSCAKNEENQTNPLTCIYVTVEHKAGETVMYNATQEIKDELYGFYTTLKTVNSNDALDTEDAYKVTLTLSDNNKVSFVLDKNGLIKLDDAEQVLKITEGSLDYIRIQAIYERYLDAKILPYGSADLICITRSDASDGTRYETVNYTLADDEAQIKNLNTYRATMRLEKIKAEDIVDGDPYMRVEFYTSGAVYSSLYVYKNGEIYTRETDTYYKPYSTMFGYSYLFDLWKDRAPVVNKKISTSSQANAE